MNMQAAKISSKKRGRYSSLVSHEFQLLCASSNFGYDGAELDILSLERIPNAK